MSGSNLTEEEASLYDRQIRLWGLDAQRRMRDAKVLLIGIKGFNSEVCKNIVLAGVNSVTILDHENVTELDLGAQIFLENEDVGRNRAEASVRNISILNPLVTINVDKDDVSKKSDDFFKSFNVVCATNCSLYQLNRIDAICRNSSIYFFGAETFGYSGYFFSDLTTYTFTKKPVEDENPSDKKNGQLPPSQPKEPEVITINFTSLQSAISADWTKFKRSAPKIFFGIMILYEFRKQNNSFPSIDQFEALQKLSREELQKHKFDSTFLDDQFLQNLVMNAKSELSPVCAILGGILGQEIIKVISGKDEPLNNFFFYNGLDYRRPGDVILIS